MVVTIDKVWQVVLIYLALFLIGCDSGKTTPVEQLVVQGNQLSVPLPGRLRQVNNLDPAAISAIATVNEVATELQLNASGHYSGDITVPSQSEFVIRIDYVEQFAGQELILARIEQPVVTTTTNTSISLLSEDFDMRSFDFDNDGVSNIMERQLNSDPLDPADSPLFISIEAIADLPTVLVDAGFSNYQVVATVGGEISAADAAAGRFRQVFRVAQQPDLELSIQLMEGVTGERIVVGEQTLVIPVAQQQAKDEVLVIFESSSWNLDFDEDADGISNADELIAGTDILVGPMVGLVPFSVRFDIPDEMVATQSLTAVLEINGQSTPLSLTGRTYSASTMAAAGMSVTIDAEIKDTFQDATLLLANFSGEATVIENGTLLLQGFSTDHDADGDGITNQVELAQGTDPLTAEGQCSAVNETVFATLAEDAFTQNGNLNNNARLQVDANERASWLRFQFNDKSAEVIDATLQLSVGTDAGDGLLTIDAVADFEWSDQAGSAPLLPATQLAGMQENEWVPGTRYNIALNPSLIRSDTTLVIQQVSGNDVGFQSSAASEPPSLELIVERCI